MCITFQNIGTQDSNVPLNSLYGLGFWISAWIVAIHKIDIRHVDHALRVEQLSDEKFSAPPKQRQYNPVRKSTSGPPFGTINEMTLILFKEPAGNCTHSP